MTDLKNKRVVVVIHRPSEAAVAVASVFGGKVKTLEQRKLLQRGKHIATGYRKI